MNPLSAQLQGKTQAEKVILKSDAIVLAVKKEKILQVGTEIEIVDIQKMDGGVEVFARAWRDGSQIGFGADGSVDIERFRIFNPPLLVDDPTGLIVREGFFDDNCKFLVTNRHLREDPKEALLQVLAKMVGQVGKVGASITPGLIGNTTSTFFSSAGAATPIDGFVQRSLATETWTQTRDGTGNLTNNSGDFQFGQGEFCAACSNRYIINRNVLLFDTSSIPDADSISSASISVTSAATGILEVSKRSTVRFMM